MLDLVAQDREYRDDIEAAISRVISSGQFIRGGEVEGFEQELASFLDVQHVIACANGTDALQVALMSLDLEPGDEVLLPAFSYISAIEVVRLLGLTPVLIDVEWDSFNLHASSIEKNISERAKAIIVVHLFGQCTDMELIMSLARRHDLTVIEDNAQSLGSKCLINDKWTYSGTIGHIGCTSFFPTKPLGCYGDGGAIMTHDPLLADRIRKISSHGQEKKYHHSSVGVNSRLDAIQAAILRVKLKSIDEYAQKRVEVSKVYDAHLNGHKLISIPSRDERVTHVFHQYTIKLPKTKRNQLKEYLSSLGISSMIYYPLPIQHQKAYEHYFAESALLNISEKLSDSVLSLPINAAMTEEDAVFIAKSVIKFFDED